MLKFPTDRLESLIYSIKEDTTQQVNKDFNGYKVSIEDVNVTRLIWDYSLCRVTISESKLTSPLAVCSTQCYANRRGVNYGYLVDLFGMRVVGNHIRIESGSSVFGNKPTFWLYKSGIAGISTQEATNYLDYRGISFSEFIRNIISNDVSNRYITPYESWLLKFICKRDALLDILNQRANNILFTTSAMKPHIERILHMENQLLIELSQLLKDYPYHAEVTCT